MPTPRAPREIPFTRSNTSPDYRTALEDVIDSVMNKNGKVINVRLDSKNPAIGIIDIEEDI